MKRYQKYCSEQFVIRFLRGYTSIFWQQSYVSLFDDTQTHRDPNWGTHLVALALELYKGVWDERNIFFHGSSKIEARSKLRSRIQQQVRDIYSNPPFLAQKYTRISSVSLEERLQRSTTRLIHWLSRIHHQSHMSQFFRKRCLERQQSIVPFLIHRSHEGCYHKKHPPYIFYWLHGLLFIGFPRFLQHSLWRMTLFCLTLFTIVKLRALKFVFICLHVITFLSALW